MTTPFRFHLFLTWLVGCTLAILVLHLTGCGSIESTQVSMDAGSTSPQGDTLAFRGEIPASSDTRVGLDVTVLQPASDGSGNSDSVDTEHRGVDGGDVNEVSPVCPPHLTCEVTSSACRALCPTCTAIQDGRCISDGFCVCRKDGGP